MMNPRKGKKKIMNNKKTIARIFAIFFAMALVVALALPCFADDTSDIDYDQIYNDFINYYGLADSLELQTLVEQYGAEQFMIQDYLYIINDCSIYVGKILQGNTLPTLGPYKIDYYSYYQSLSYFAMSVEDTVFSIYGPSVVYEWNYHDIAYYMLVDNENMRLDFVLEYYYNFDSGYYELDTSNEFVTNLVFLTNTPIDDIMPVFSETYSTYSPKEFLNGYTSNKTVVSDPSFVPTSKTGLFGQLYYILKDAVYGSDTVIGTSQDFILTFPAQTTHADVTLIK